MESTKKNIMLIEDDHTLREVMSVLLQDEGHSVATAEDGQVGIDKLLHCDEANYPDCIVLDLKMPNMSGDQFLLELKKNGKDKLNTIPVIVCSAEGTIGPHPQVKARLQKPVSLELLFGAIEGCSYLS